MHQALLIPEVLLEIFTHLGTIWNLSESFNDHKSLVRKSLAALAVTCKAFYEPAMDLLWADFDHREGLKPLLGCVTRLHPLIYNIGPMRNKSTWPIGVQPLSADEARQFLRHSRRVRSLCVPSDHFVRLLSAIPVEACVFTRLQSLDWCASTAKCFDLFLSRTLRTCSLWTLTKDLQSIVARLDTLEHFTVTEYEPDELSLLSDSVRLCKRLVTLDCPLLDWAGWNHLSNLPTLLSLYITEERTVPPWPLEQDIVNFSPFLNVTSLSFLLENVASAITVMEHSQFPSLKRFEFILEEMSAAEVARLCRALSRCNACQTLDRINIVSFLSQGPLTIIPHLLCFTQLQDLRLHCKDSFICLDNNDLLLEAMSAWPHLRKLDIENSYIHPSITFRGLFAALRQCPRLHFLRIAVDVVNIDIDPDAELIRHTSLEELELITAPESLIPNAEALARLVFTCLPCVEHVGLMKYDGKRWDEVNNHLDSLRDREAISQT